MPDENDKIFIDNNPVKDIFKEEHENAMVVIYKMQSDINKDDMKDCANEAIDEMEEVGIPTAEAGIQMNSNGCFIAVRLVSTNINSEIVADVISVGKQLGGYKDTIISTVAVDRIDRF